MQKLKNKKKFEKIIIFKKNLLCFLKKCFYSGKKRRIM